MKLQGKLLLLVDTLIKYLYLLIYNSKTIHYLRDEKIAKIFNLLSVN